MSLPNLANNLVQPQQNIVMNQVPLTHTMMTNVNANNGIPLATALAHAPTNESNEMKPGMMVETIPMASSANFQSAQMKSMPAAPAGSSDTTQVVTKQRLQDLVRDTDSVLNLEEEVEEIILNYVDEFVDRCLNGAALIAKNRHGNSIEVKDVQQFLNRNYNMWTPGFGTDELRPYKRSLTTEAHKQRMALIRKTIRKF